MINSVTKEYLMSKCNVITSNIFDGLNYYNHDIKQFTTLEETYDYIIPLFVQNKEEAFIDFYANKLDTNSYNILLKSVCSESKKTLKVFEKYLGSEYIYYFTTSVNLIKSIIELNYNEIFFCNIYFNNLNLMIWPNFDGEIIIFFK